MRGFQRSGLIPLSVPDLSGAARARRSDPEESHGAAKSVRGITEKQGAVLACLTLAGRPLTDPEIREIYEREWEAEGWPRQTDSGLRTRRNELVRAGLVARAGRKRLESGRMAATWDLPIRIAGQQALGQAA